MNYILTERRVLASIPSYCLQPPVSGAAVRCNSNVRSSVKYYYDSRTRDCEKIVYSGCAGTQNLFNNKFDCEARCEKFGDRSVEIGDFFDFDK